jgi:DNA-binding HxlR family transcriptional regulator
MLVTSCLQVSIIPTAMRSTIEAVEQAPTEVEPDAPAGASPESPEGPEAGPLAALGEALDAVGDRWSLLLIAALLDGPRRFGDLQRDLRRLEEQGVLVAEPYSERPPRFVYDLTSSGRDLAAALRLLADWGARHREGAEPPRHGACGTPLEAVWWCPTCERPVRADEAADLHFA